MADRTPIGASARNIGLIASLDVSTSVRAATSLQHCETKKTVTSTICELRGVVLLLGTAVANRSSLARPKLHRPLATTPTVEGEAPAAETPVYHLRVRGTADLELVYEIVQPDGTPDHLSVGVRRSIGLVRLGGDDRNDRDLRLVQGSALDRLVGDTTVSLDRTGQ